MTLNGPFKSFKYWVIGPSNYFRANLVHWYGHEHCHTPGIEDSDLPIINEDISGVSATAAVTSNLLMPADNPAGGVISYLNIGAFLVLRISLR